MMRLLTAFMLMGAPWPAGCDFAHPPTVAWEAADVDWMNVIHNACFELEPLESWTTRGAVQLAPGNGWGNAVAGTGQHPTGTSKHELRLGRGPAAAEQAVVGLHPATPHTLSGWLRVSDARESVRLGVRAADGTETWSAPVSSTTWTRVLVPFVTGAAQTGATVVLEKTSPGDGFAFADNLGLPRAVQ